MNENKLEITTINPEIENKFAVLAESAGAPVRESTTTETTKLFNAVNGGADSCKVLVDKDPIEVTDIVVTSADVHTDKDDDESPLENRPVAHFFTKDGKHYSSLSNGIVRTVKNLLMCGIIPTVENPLKIQFRSKETKRGTAFVFELV